MEPLPDAFADFEAAGWEQVADGYAESDVVRQLTGEAASAMVDAVEAGKGRRILDVACGPGYASAAAAARGATVVGTDIASAMVTTAARNVPSAEFRQSRAESLPFDDADFDGVVCGFGLPHFAEPETVFAEVARVLEPGGHMAFTTWCTPDKVPFFGLVFTAVVEHGSFDVDLPDGPDMFRFASEDEARTTLSGIGYQDVSVRELPLEARIDDPGDALDLVFRATVRTRALLEGQTPAAREAIATSLTDAVRDMTVDDQIVVPMPAVLISATHP